jgi:hypothetical protein
MSEHPPAHPRAHWADALDADALYQLATDPAQVPLGADESDAAARLAWVMHDMQPGAPIDELGTQLLPRAIDGDAMYAFWPDYWEKLKHEFRVLVCTADKRYADLRKKLAASADKAQTAVVSAIAAAMAAQFGVVAGVLVPFVALCLIVLARTGREAFCATGDWNQPLQKAGAPSGA